MDPFGTRLQRRHGRPRTRVRRRRPPRLPAGGLGSRRRRRGRPPLLPGLRRGLGRPGRAGQAAVGLLRAARLARHRGPGGDGGGVPRRRHAGPPRRQARRHRLHRPGVRRGLPRPGRPAGRRRHHRQPLPRDRLARPDGRPRPRPRRRGLRARADLQPRGPAGPAGAHHGRAHRRKHASPRPSWGADELNRRCGDGGSTAPVRRCTGDRWPASGLLRGRGRRDRRAEPGADRRAGLRRPGAHARGRRPGRHRRGGAGAGRRRPRAGAALDQPRAPRGRARPAARCATPRRAPTSSSRRRSVAEPVGEPVGEPGDRDWRGAATWPTVPRSARTPGDASSYRSWRSPCGDDGCLRWGGEEEDYCAALPRAPPGALRPRRQQAEAAKSGESVDVLTPTLDRLRGPAGRRRPTTSRTSGTPWCSPTATWRRRWRPAGSTRRSSGSARSPRGSLRRTARRWPGWRASSGRRGWWRPPTASRATPPRSARRPRTGPTRRAADRGALTRVAFAARATA